MCYVLFFYTEHLKNSDILIVRIKKIVSQHEHFTALDGNTKTRFEMAQTKHLLITITS